MAVYDKFQNKLQCVCTSCVIFEIVGDIECDWGTHIVIQCPNCEELFSVDNECPAFQSVLKLSKINPKLYSKKEECDYLLNSHLK